MANHLGKSSKTKADQSFKEKLILALDCPNAELAMQMVNDLDEEICFYKLGLGLMASGDYFNLLNKIKAKNKKIFADLKLFDIPQTIATAVQNLAAFEIDFLTIHTASHEIMEAAAAKKGKMKILGVTVLTSLNEVDLLAMGFDEKFSIDELVIKKAKLALECGLDGVVASPLEAKILRQNLGQDFLIITPGIREESAADDQKRTSTVSLALKNGASHLVIGRPITAAKNPKIAAQNFLQKINEASRFN